MGCTSPASQADEKPQQADEKCEAIRVFHFPLKRNTHLLPYWEKFVNRGPEWKASQNTVLCSRHFDPKLITINDRCATLNWKANPIPTFHVGEKYKEHPSLIPTPVVMRKPPKKRVFQEDEMPIFLQEVDPTIKEMTELEKHIPAGFSCRKTSDYILFYRIEFNEATGFPRICESIKVDSELHVQLQYNGDPVPLPPWFIKGRNAKLTRVSMLENLPAYIRNVATETPFTILDELNERKNFKPKGRPPYSAAMIRFALHLRYTSAQAYRLLLEKFPLPSFSLLNKIQKGGVDAVKSIKLLREKGKLSKDVILMVDEMFLQKCLQYMAGERVGENEKGELYKGIIGFMIAGMKESIPYMIQTIPEVTFTGKWLCDKIADNIQTLIDAGFRVRAVVSDNHSTNVSAFDFLRKRFKSESPLHFTNPADNNKTYLFFDNVHLIKNIRNNLLNGKKFVFPSFNFDNGNIKIDCPDGYIAWSDLHRLYERDSKLKGNLRKAPKLSYRALHPGNKKQNVPLALAIFDESTIAGIKDYYPERNDMSSFLSIINTWWLIANSKEQFNPNPIGNAVVDGDGKIQFFRELADWIEMWQKSPNFTLTAQTSGALITTLRAQAALIEDLLAEGYDYVLVARFQSDPLERRFSQYRQMSGGRFLVGLREVSCSERILACRSLILEDIDFWKENIRPQISEANVAEFLEEVSVLETEIQECSLDDDSREVSTMLAGYVSLQLQSRSKCTSCKEKLVTDADGVEKDKYLKILSRGGLTTPSQSLADFVDDCFAILDFIDPLFVQHKITKVRDVSIKVLEQYGPKPAFVCSKHLEWGSKFAMKPIINIFNNNKQKLSTDAVRKDNVAEYKRVKRLKEN